MKNKTLIAFALGSLLTLPAACDLNWNVIGARSINCLESGLAAEAGNLAPYLAGQLAAGKPLDSNTILTGLTGRALDVAACALASIASTPATSSIVSMPDPRRAKIDRWLAARNLKPYYLPSQLSWQHR